MGRMNLMSQLFGQAQDVVTVVSFAAGLLVYAPWLIVLLAVALVPRSSARRTSTRRATRSNFAWTPERRELEYVRADRRQRGDREGGEDLRPHRVPDRALPRAGATVLLHANRKLATRRAGWGALLAALGTLGLLRRLRLHRLAHGAGRFHHRRPDLPRRQLPPPAAICSKAC